ncbi:MAG: hypothetical protein ABR525_11645, partial [Candidatus Limnocylindria bacterium]
GYGRNADAYHVTAPSPGGVGAAACMELALVDAGLEHVARHVNAAASAGGFDMPDAHLSRMPVVVDAEGWRALAGELDALNERVQEIGAQSAARLEAAEEEDGAEATVVLMLFSSAPTDAAAPDAVDLPAGSGRVELRDVTFAYGDDVDAHAEPALRDLSLTVEPGTTLALVGGTGSG